MSTPFYDLASLVVVPSGYKASKVYAQKPLTTDGQLAFTRSTTATRVNSAGLIESVAINVPRLDYLNSTCPRLLLEPQRTNVLQFSEQFNNAVYQKQLGASVTANTTISPDGTQNADTLSIQPMQYMFQAFSPSVSTAYTFSIYVKVASGTKQFKMSTFSGTGNEFESPAFTATTQWQRFSLTFTAVSTANTGFYPINQDAFTGGDFIIYGAQVEVGAYATSYIPTLGAAVTRGADAASKTGISSLIGQTEGTLFAEVNLALNGDSAGILAITGVGVTFIYLFTAGNTNVLNANVYVSGAQQANMTYTLPSAGTYKIAVGYKANDFVLYVNGVQRGSDNSGSVPACSDLYIDSTTYNILPNIKHSQALLFKTRLTNAQLAELTTI